VIPSSTPPNTLAMSMSTLAMSMSMSMSSLEFKGLFDNSGQMNDGSNGKVESSSKGGKIMRQNHGNDNAMSMPMVSLEFISLFDKDGQMNNGSKGKVASKSKGVKIRRHHCYDNGEYGYEKNAGYGGYDAEGYYYYGRYGGGYDYSTKSGKGSYGYGGGGSGNSSDKEKSSGEGLWGFGKVEDGAWRHDDVGNDAQYKYRAQQFHLRRKN
jgi:hypothetical protein